MGRTSNSKITTVEMCSRDFLLTLHYFFFLHRVALQLALRPVLNWEPKHKREPTMADTSLN